MYYLKEFEGLLDELLFRLNVLSDSLHHTLPAKAHHYRADSPVVSPVPRHLDTKVIPYVFRESLQGMLKKKKKSACWTVGAV